MLFKVINHGPADRGFHNAAGRLSIIPPGQPKAAKVDLRPETALDIRRLELRGDKISIEAVDEEGEAVLSGTKGRPPRRYGMIGQGAKDEAMAAAMVTRGERGFRDELAQPVPETPQQEPTEPVEAPVGAEVAPVAETPVQAPRKAKAKSTRRKLKA